MFEQDKGTGKKAVKQYGSGAAEGKAPIKDLGGLCVSEDPDC